MADVKQSKLEMNWTYLEIITAQNLIDTRVFRLIYVELTLNVLVNMCARSLIRITDMRCHIN